jgi:glycosyltransferase involved in cell wall biosynthesis
MHIVMTRREALDVPDGINIFLFSIADALQESGHRVTMVATAATNTEKLQDYFAPRRMPQIVSLGTHTEIQYRKALYTWVTKGSQALQKLSPDFIVVNGVVPIRLPGLTCAVSHDIEKRFKHPILRDVYKRWCYGQTDITVATCTEVRSALSADLGRPEQEIAVIPTCVRLDNYKSKLIEQREDAVLHLGTARYKNPIATLRAFARIARPGRKLYLTGKVTPEVQEFLHQMPAAARECVETPGYVSSERLLDLLGSVKVISVPSVYNVPVASPTVIEAFASATPVVGTTSISSQVLQHERNGYVCDPANADQLTAAFERLLNDRSKWHTLSQHASTTSSLFCSKRVAQMYVDLANSRLQRRATEITTRASRQRMPKEPRYEGSNPGGWSRNTASRRD